MIAFIRMAVDTAVQRIRASGGTDLVIQLIPADMQNLIAQNLVGLSSNPGTYAGVPVVQAEAYSQIAYHLHDQLLSVPLSLVAAYLV